MANIRILLKDKFKDLNVVYPIFDIEMLDEIIQETDLPINEIFIEEIKIVNLLHENNLNDDETIVFALTSHKFKNFVNFKIINCLLKSTDKIIEDLSSISEISSYFEKDVISAVFQYFLNAFEMEGIFNPYVKKLLLNDELGLSCSIPKDIIFMYLKNGASKR